ncbi:hypothetical protein BDZ97DRAFT_1657173 [Flammula alnicola]|nr:hypothetical protein BDZ97DRAFT_1657173 [Flammula alnicola]
MASDSSDSPMVLTPESTGTSGPVSTPNSPPLLKKARRQTAFYPNMNSSNKQQKPFSRSAAKRESVMALGSIEHLQHYFTKTGLAAKKNPLDKPHHGLVPAIGGLQIPTSPAALSDIAEFQMPPSPAIPTVPRPAFSPHIKTYEVDPESLLPGVIEDVIAVAHAWKLETYAPDVDAEPLTKLDVPFDVLEVLKTTTRAIRSTRNYLLSLPDESAGTIRAQFRPQSLGPGQLVKSKSNSNLSGSSQAQGQGQGQQDPLVLIRRGALEVLTVLRQLEENCRLPLEDDAYDAGSDGGHSRGAGTASSPSNTTLELPQQPHALELERSSSSLAGHAHLGADPDVSMTFSLVQVQGRFESVPVWEDEDDGFGAEPEEEEQRRERWDERLVLGSGWLYRQDVKLRELAKERSMVGRYLDIVDEVLFEGRKGVGTGGNGKEERGWERVRRKREGRASSRAAKNRRVSTGMSDTELGLPSPGGSDAGRRRVSTGMINITRGMSLSEEPEEMDGIKEEEEEEYVHGAREGAGEEMIDDEELPEWAKRSSFGSDRLGRAHALLSYFLPAHLRSTLSDPSSTSRTAFLASLSSGQLLCIAYNGCVRKSKKPWGFVSKDGVHDIIALEKAAQKNAEEEGNGDAGKDGGKKLWSFRRTDNLRLWAGALKLRYIMPIQLPSQPVILSSSSRQALPNPNAIYSNTNSATNTPLPSPGITERFGFPGISLGQGKADREPPILFDARIIAKKEDGWEDMLEDLLLKWVDKVVQERRVFHQ